MNCTSRENETEWLRANGKDINKDVLKRMITIGIAIEEAAKNTDVDPRNHMRRLKEGLIGEEDSEWKTGDAELDAWMAEWMKIEMMATEKE